MVFFSKITFVISESHWFMLILRIDLRFIIPTQLSDTMHSFVDGRILIILDIIKIARCTMYILSPHRFVYLGSTLSMGDNKHVHITNIMKSQNSKISYLPD